VTSVVCARDRFLPPALQRRLAHERLGVVGVEIASGHCAALSRPGALADVLEAAADGTASDREEPGHGS
jgi:hypothetical protein